MARSTLLCRHPFCVDWLAYAGRGELSEPWHHFRHPQSLALEQAVAGTATIGTSSGRAALAGLLCVLEALGDHRIAR